MPPRLRRGQQRTSTTTEKRSTPRQVGTAGSRMDHGDQASEVAPPSPSTGVDSDVAWAHTLASTWVLAPRSAHRDRHCLAGRRACAGVLLAFDQWPGPHRPRGIRFPTMTALAVKNRWRSACEGVTALAFDAARVGTSLAGQAYSPRKTRSAFSPHRGANGIGFARPSAEAMTS